jgi:hypothetical protein
MQTIQVTQDFVLSLDDGTKRPFKQGVHEVDDAIAEHWYVKAHSVPAAPPVAVSEPEPPPPPTPKASKAK